jgi:hypothetical protein
MSSARIAILLALCALLVPCAWADEVVLPVFKDNTIYSESSNSNGAGEFLYVGETGIGDSRRALIMFDIASMVPAGSTIESVTLEMYINRGAGSQPISAHRVLKDWGEGDSNAGDPGGRGSFPSIGDVTWNYRFYHPDTPEPWVTDGGEYAAIASGSGLGNPASFGTFTEFEIVSNSTMVAEVQQWLDNPATNFGWILIGNENAGGTAKRFNSSEYSSDPSLRPALNITYTGPTGTKFIADANSSWGQGANWAGNQVPDGATARVVFGDSSSGPRTVTLDGNRQVREIQFNHFHPWTIAAGTPGSSTLTIGSFGGLGSLSGGAGGHVIAAKVILPGTTDIQVAGDGAIHLAGGAEIGAGQRVTKSGEGILSIDGPQTHGAGAKLDVYNGSVHLRSNAGAPGSAGAAASANLSVSVRNSGSASDGSFAVLESSQDLADLEISYIDPMSQGVDLASTETEFHAIRIHGSNLDDAKASMAGAIRNANAPGAADGRDGIFDSGLHSGAGIGVAKLVDAHGDGYVLVRATRVGDLNLDGTVTIADFLGLAGNFNGFGTWQEGDINHDGQVTIADFLALAGNFNSSYSGGSLPISDGDLGMLNSFAMAHGVTLVPEPGLISLIVLGVVGLRRRRR